MRRCQHISKHLRALSVGVPGTEPQWAQIMFRRVGHHGADAVYRALSRVLHPDSPTGDTSLQRELNEARNR